MAGADTLTFTESNFQSEVLQSDLPVLVDFWAEWCGPCRMLGPTIDQIATELKGKAKVGKLDIDQAQMLAASLNIQSIPTVILFKGGKPVNKWVGIRPKNDYVNAATGAA
ncbi:MAG: thioredoxin [Phycisphaerales bacterium]|jgi:thioredoxin 1